MQGGCCLHRAQEAKVGNSKGAGAARPCGRLGNTQRTALSQASQNLETELSTDNKFVSQIRKMPIDYFC